MQTRQATWPVREARQNFRKLIERAEREGPQVITDHGMERAVLISIEKYRSLAAEQSNMIEFLMGAGPRFDELPGIERHAGDWRSVDLG